MLGCMGRRGAGESHARDARYKAAVHASKAQRKKRVQQKTEFRATVHQVLGEVNGSVSATLSTTNIEFRRNSG